MVEQCAAPISVNPDAAPVEWRVSQGLTAYTAAVQFMEDQVAAIRSGTAPEMVWLVEHPPIYTAGTSAKPQDLLSPGRFPVYYSGRGGQYTYHGPGQRVAYVMLDLKQRGPDIAQLVCNLEKWLKDTLACFGVIGETRQGRVGTWVARPDGSGEDKIAAVGVRVRRWVSYHGVSLNVNPELAHFSGIVPCGEKQHGVTSLAQLGVKTSMAEVDAALRKCFAPVFGRIR